MYRYRSVCEAQNPHNGPTHSTTLQQTITMIHYSQAVTILVVCLILTSVNAFAMKPTKQPTSETMKRYSEPQEESESFKPRTWNPLRLLVLKLGLTEPAWISPWNYQKPQVGTFICAYCDKDLFDANSKYDSGSGWPSFWRTKGEGAVTLVQEFDGRVECTCSRCKSHLGHVFMDGPRKENVDVALVSSIPASDPKGRQENSRLPRFCINGAALKFEAKIEE